VLVVSVYFTAGYLQIASKVIAVSVLFLCWRSEGFATVLKIKVLWDVMPCRLVPLPNCDFSVYASLSCDLELKQMLGESDR
jgi:hypothetical protein